jgi:endonuclease-3
LVATILSAQCTDERVNQVTRELFKTYKTPEDFVALPLEVLEDLIRPTGFYKNKAKAIKGCASEIVERFHGKVPGTIEELLTLPGVGRKTANVVLGAVYDVPGIVVDTHVKRLSKRLGLVEAQDPDRIEEELQGLLPPENWRRFSDVLIYHGRAVCKARGPLHDNCVIRELCPSRDTERTLGALRFRDLHLARGVLISPVPFNCLQVLAVGPGKMMGAIPL